MFQMYSSAHDVLLLSKSPAYWQLLGWLKVRVSAARWRVCRSPGAEQRRSQLSHFCLGLLKVGVSAMEWYFAAQLL